MLSVTLPQELETQLKSLADQTGQSISEHIRDAVTQYFSDLENDKQDLRLAMDSLHEIEAGGKTVTLDELEDDLGLRNPS